MSSPDIREIIATAVEQENATHNLLQRLRDNIPQLTDRLELPEDAPEQALLEFITSYIESVPGCISLVTAVSKQFGFHDYAAPFLHIAEDYFLQPPDEVPETGGLALLLDEAFLAHRLLEEVNDHHIRHVQRPLLPQDMTEANIIVHHLLGEPLAGRLEQLVQYTASRLLEKEHVWDNVRKIPGSTAITMPLMDSLNRRTHSVRLRLIPTA
ncbi:MAG: hypothetical protein ACJAYC_001768 [Halieaceae bacterium]|jgi:hypothetical protein